MSADMRGPAVALPASTERWVFGVVTCLCTARMLWGSVQSSTDWIWWLRDVVVGRCGDKTTTVRR